MARTRKTRVNKTRKTLVNKKRQKKGAGHEKLTEKMLSTLFPEHIPELIIQMTQPNRDLFKKLDKEFYIRDYLKNNDLTMNEQNIKKYGKETKNQIDLYLFYLNSLNEVKKRKKNAEAKIIKYEDDIKSKNQELTQIKSQRVTRSHKNTPSQNNTKIEKIENEIKHLKDKINALKYRIQKNFRGLSPMQDDYI